MKKPRKAILYASIAERLAGKTLKAALLIAGGLALMEVGASAQTVIDFSTLPSGMQITNQYASKGITFATENGRGVFGAPAIGGSPYLGGLSNSPTGVYPTTQSLNFNFTAPATVQYFYFNNYGNNGVSTYSIYSSNGTLLGSGNVGSLAAANSPTLITLNLANVSEIQFSNGEPVGSDWEFVIDSISFGKIVGPVVSPVVSTIFSGPTIQNSAPVGIPTIADFLVMGPVETGGSADNTVNSLTFTKGSSLTVHNTLTVTKGPVVLVNGSGMTLDGSLSTTQLEMQAGSTLNGNGSILGNLSNAGIVKPGDAPGTIRVTGNYTQAANGLLQIAIGGLDAGQHDLLSIGGSAKLAGGLQFQQANGFRFTAPGQKVTFLTADGGVDGKFSAVDTSAFLNAVVIYEPNAVILEAAPGILGTTLKELGGIPKNLLGVAGGLDGAANDPRAGRIFAILAADDLTQLVKDIQHLSPDQLTSTSSVASSTSGVHLQNLQLRMEALQSGVTGFSALGFHITDNSTDTGSGYAGPSGPDGKSSKEIVAPPVENNRWGSFITGAGEFDHVGDTETARGFNLDSGGITLGVDYRFTDHFVAGIFTGYTYTGIDIGDGGRIAVNAGKVGLYATYFSGGFYVDTAAQGGYNSYETNRAGLGGTAHSSPIGGDLNLLFAPGYNFTFGGLTVGPTTRFQYAYQSTNGFTESGSLAPLTVNSQHSDSLISAFGMKASYDWKLGSSILRPELRLEWEHEYGDVASSIVGQLASGAGDPFTVTGPEIGRDSMHLGAGFSVVFSERLSAYVYYDGEFFRTNYDSSTVTGGFRVTF